MWSLRIPSVRAQEEVRDMDWKLEERESYVEAES